MRELILGHEEAGYGRIITLNSKILMDVLINRIKSGLGLKYGILSFLRSTKMGVQVGRPRKGENSLIGSIAVCAGSGSGVFKLVSKEVDVLLTGELSHHEVLAAIAKGQHVILCGHTNTERGFLKTLQHKLQDDLDTKVGASQIQVVISTQDHDPLETM